MFPACLAISACPKCLLRLLILFTLSASVAFCQSGFEQFAAAAGQAREANQVPQAIQLYRSALNLKPDWPEGLFYLGSLLYDSDQFSAAESILQKFVKTTPEAGPAFGLLGLCEFETGHYTNALANIERAPAQTGQMGAVLRFHEAQLLTKTGNYEKALQLFASFLNEGAAPAPVLVPLGIAALHRPLLPAETQPAQQELYIAAGQTATAILSGDAARSRAALANLLDRFPNSSGVHFLNGFYFLTQDPPLALDEFKRELSIDPSNVSANAMVAWMLLNRRESEAALPYAERAASAAPDNPIALYVYGRLLAESRDAKQAIAYLEKAVTLDPQNLEAHLALTGAYSKLGRTDDARRARARSIQLAREVAPAYLH